MKTFLITGAAQGFGLELARALLDADVSHHVVLAVRRPEAAPQLDPAVAYGLVSSGARAVLGIESGGVEAGASAELLAVAGGSLQEVLATATEDRLVFRRGELVERTRVVRGNCKRQDEEG